MSQSRSGFLPDFESGSGTGNLILSQYLCHSLVLAFCLILSLASATGNVILNMFLCQSLVLAFCVNVSLTLALPILF